MAAQVWAFPSLRSDGRHCNRPRSSWLMTARPTRPVRRQSGLARSAWWTWLFATVRVVAAARPSTRFATGELLLTVDADTIFEPSAVARLATAFKDRESPARACNIAISNGRDS